MKTSIRRVNVIFLTSLFLFLVTCVLGPLAAKFRTGGAWLWIWPLAFGLVRFFAFFIFPVFAVALMYLKHRNGSGGSLTYVNIVLTVILGLTVLGIESFTKSEANSTFTKRFGDASPAEVLNRDVDARSLPTLSLLDSNGQAVDLAEQVRTARVTLVVFFASYNVGWSDNVKTAREIHRTMAKDGVLVLGINEQESQAAINTFITKQQLNFPIFRDSNGKYLHSVGVPGSVEQMLVVDKSGKVIARRSRDSEPIEQIKKALISQIKQ